MNKSSREEELIIGGPINMHHALSVLGYLLMLEIRVKIVLFHCLSPVNTAKCDSGNCQQNMKRNLTVTLWV